MIASLDFLGRVWPHLSARQGSSISTSHHLHQLRSLCRTLCSVTSQVRLESLTRHESYLMLDLWNHETFAPLKHASTVLSSLVVRSMLFCEHPRSGLAMQVRLNLNHQLRSKRYLVRLRRIMFMLATSYVF